MDAARLGAQRVGGSGGAWDPAITTYGHFTAMQVRDGRTRGLDLHLRRLAGATRELFDAELDETLVRASIREALGGTSDASVRVYVFHTERGPSTMVTVRPPAGPPETPQRLRSVHYLRPLAHLKHLGGFRLGGLDAQTYFRMRAEAEGFDDALFTGPGGVVAEATIANIGFFEGPTVVWPDGPALAGITMQVLQRELTARGGEWRTGRVTLDEVRSFEGAFLANSRGVCAVSRIDEVDYEVDDRRMAALLEAYDAAPWPEI